MLASRKEKRISFVQQDRKEKRISFMQQDSTPSGNWRRGVDAIREESAAEKRGSVEQGERLRAISREITHAGSSKSSTLGPSRRSSVVTAVETAEATATMEPSMGMAGGAAAPTLKATTRC